MRSCWDEMKQLNGEASSPTAVLVKQRVEALLHPSVDLSIQSLVHQAALSLGQPLRGKSSPCWLTIDVIVVHFKINIYTLLLQHSASAGTQRASGTGYLRTISDDPQRSRWRREWRTVSQWCVSVSPEGRVDEFN